MTEPVPVSSDAHDVRRRQLRQIGAGCSGCGVVLLALGLFVGGFAGLQHALRRGTLGPASETLVVMGRPEKHADAIVWIGAVTLVIAVIPFGVRTVAGAVARAVVVLALGTMVIWLACYREFMAMRPHGDTDVELRYLWPRPSVVIDARAASVRQESEIIEIGDTPTSVDYLVLTVDGVTRRSTASGSVRDARDFLVARGARFER